MNVLIRFWYRNNNKTFRSFNNTENAVKPDYAAEALSREMTQAVLPITLIIATVDVFGVIGNIFILIVYYKWYKVCNFRCFVLYMACIDLTSTLTTLPGEIFSQMNWYSYPYDALCKAKSFFNVFTVWSAGLILLLLAYDRYRKICHPLSWQVPVKTSARLCFASVLFAFTISTPTAVFWGKQSYDYIYRNISVRVCICEKSDSYAYDLVPFVYTLCAFVAPMFLIVLTTATLNIRTARKLLIGRRREHNESHNNDRRTLPIDKDDRRFQLSYPKKAYDDISRHSKHKRRFSFPADKSTTERKHLIDPKSQLRHSERQIEDIPENNNDCIYQTRHTLIEIFPTRRLRLHRAKFFFGPNGIDRQKPLRRLNMWQTRYLRRRVSSRRKKTLIMLILSGVFIVTMSLYLGLVCKVANTEGVLKALTNSQKVVFFLFWRLYFINTLINPVLYGLMDQRFRKGLVRLFCSHAYYMRKYSTSVM
ncbi:uncharacterized protein LOC128559708 [Mercenaria mercenaria]|uniref:uncharacterized protein LOC128559708 n=1 Tax=Mercenaria mercenaria TaxID=6596 RepID=UPI00234ECDD5|nr:uncharacterized protein LOC128559708 [Mercenaria mercenaria]